VLGIKGNLTVSFVGDEVKLSWLMEHDKNGFAKRFGGLAIWEPKKYVSIQ
jgi:hypothetical protein